MVSTLLIRFQMVSPWVAIKAMRVACRERKAKPKATTDKNWLA